MVLEQVPGQDAAMAFLRGAAERPHHAYVFAGPEGSGKSLAARAFAASLLCANGGCGECRDCRLALRDQHPNEFVVEPEGRDIHVDTVRDEVWHPAYLTPPEPGRKVFLIREADRLSPAAADTLLKVLEEPPATPSSSCCRLGRTSSRRRLEEPVPHRDLHGAQRAVRGRTARGRGCRADPGTARRAPGRREPRPRAADGGG